MKLIVTGANSFIGQRFIDKASKLGAEITIVIRPGSKFPNPRLNTKIVYLSLEQYDQLGKMAGGCDCFVHLAWNGTRGLSRMDEDLQKSNYKYSLAGIESMLAAGCRCIITAGSQAEYGLQKGIITEDTLCQPNTEYGKYKLCFYEAVSKLCAQKNIAYKEPRFFSLYGPGDYQGTMVLNVLNNMLANRPCKLTHAIQMWDFLYIDDAIDGLVRLCSIACADGIYNFGNGDARPLREFIEAMAQITQTKSELLYGAVAYPETGMVSIWPDVSKAKCKLQWEHRTPFSEGIRKVIKSLKISPPYI